MTNIIFYRLISLVQCTINCRFRPNSLTISIPEETPNARIALPNSHDPDSPPNARRSYWLSSSEDSRNATSSLFELIVPINTSSRPLLALRQGATLNRERHAVYHLKLHVRDTSPKPQSGRLIGVGGGGGVASWEDVLEVELQVGDVNDHTPQFEREFYSVAVYEEDDVVGRELVRVGALDEDVGSNAQLKYSLLSVSWTSNEWLQVNETTGIVTNRLPLDCESDAPKPQQIQGDKKKFCLRLETVIVARDGGGLEGRTRVIVSVRPRNEYRPIIELRPASLSAASGASSSVRDPTRPPALSIVEHAASGTLVGFVRALDRDSSDEMETLSCALSLTSPSVPQPLFQLRRLSSAPEASPAGGIRELQYTVQVAHGPVVSALLDRELYENALLDIVCTDGTFNTTLNAEVKNCILEFGSCQ